MDDVTASIIIACQTAGAVNSINKLGFAFGMLGRKAIEFGAESIRIFSDLQEETQKFGTVFAGVQNEANKHVQELINNFGQSELSARKMMAQTGDLLRGTGMSQEDIAAISGGLSKLGSDLASFSNYAGGAEGSTFSLTKAMLGETEMAKSLGVFIKTDTKEFKDLEKQAKTTGIYIDYFGKTFKASTDIQARAFASLAQEFQQKGYVLGDFWRNQGSIANQSRTMANRLDELKATIGGFLDSVIHVGDVKGQFADTLASITGHIKENSAEWAYQVSSFLNIWRGGFEIIGGIAGEAFYNIGEVISWFGRNWGKIWDNSLEITKAVFKDIFETIKYAGNLFVEFFKTVGISIGKAIKAGISGENIMDEVKKEFSQFSERAVIKFAGLGKNMEIALKNAGVDSLKLKPIDFSKILEEAEERYNARQREINARKGQQSPAQGGGGNNGNKNFVNFSLSMQSIADQISKFRSATQSAVFANSVDALRLQSRVLTQSPEMKVQQSQLDTLKQIKNGIDKLVGPARTSPTMVRS